MTDIITSLQNPRVKLAHTLQTRPRARRKERKIALEGTRLMSDALERGHKPQFVLYETQSADYDLIARLQGLNTDLIAVTPEIMQHISDTQQPQGVVGVFPMPRPRLPDKPRRVLILDAVREPGNLGTILRTAGAAGVDVVLLAPDCVDPYNPKVLRAGMGAHFRVPLVEASWPEIAAYCEALDVYLAVAESQTAYSAVDWTRRWALVIGNEAHGVTDAATDALPQAPAIAIPMAAATESLNAAAAAAVMLFEAQRQRRHSQGQKT